MILLSNDLPLMGHYKIYIVCQKSRIALHMQEQTQKKNPNTDTEMPLDAKLARMQKRHYKMFENINLLVSQSIEAIEKAQIELEQESFTHKQVMDHLHQSMASIKPLKNLKEEYNQFYKKLSGVGKNIEQMCMQEQVALETGKIFDEYDFITIEESLVDYYLRNKQYEAADALNPQNAKRKLYEECQAMKNDIMNSSFERPSKWAESSIISRKQRIVSYQIKKMKTIQMVRDNMGSQALDYCKLHLTMYTDIKEEEIRRLITYILTESQSMWGGVSEQIKKLFQDRYKDFITYSLESLSTQFEQAYYRVNNMEIQNSIAKCFFIGSKYKEKFIEQISFLPHTDEPPKVLPFSIPIDSSEKYHSQLFCPVSKEVYSSSERTILLKCGHIISYVAHSKMVESRSRKKLKCPVCQEEQNTEHNLEVVF